MITMTVKVRTAAKDYPAFGVTKGQRIYKWRAGGKKHIALTDPRSAPVTEPKAGVTVEAAAKKRAAKAKVAPVVTEDMPPE